MYRGRRGRDRMVVGYITTYAISGYHHLRCEFQSHSGEMYSIQHYAIKFVIDLRQFGFFSPGNPISSTNKADRHDIAEILLKVALNIITLTLTLFTHQARRVSSRVYMCYIYIE